MQKLYLITVFILWFSGQVKAQNGTIPIFSNTSISDPEPILAVNLIFPEPSHVKYELYTRKTFRGYELLVHGNYKILQASSYSPGRNTYVLVHGFGETTNTEWITAARKALLYTGDRNVIVIDWSPLAKAPRYDQALFSVDFVGEYLGKFLRFLNVDPGRVHLIGFSLGAHVAAASGNYFKPGRITGLDPAGPGFENVPLRKKLDYRDAWLVDIIHTNAGDLLSGHFGTTESTGHIDFYPNGGFDQPGCGSVFPSVIDSLTNLDFKKIRPCSHMRSTKYFIESIYPELPKYTGYSCNYEDLESGHCRTIRTNTMGLRIDPSVRGIFVLKTDSEPPFALNTYNLHVRVGFQPGLSGTLSALSAFGELEFLFLLPDKPLQVTLKSERGVRRGQVLSASVSVSPAVRLTDIGVLATLTNLNFQDNFYSVPVESVSLSSPDGQLSFCLGEFVLFSSRETVLLKISPKSCNSS